MMTEKKPFARLFETDDIGQILAVVDENDDGNPSVCLRIADAYGLNFKMHVSFTNEDYDIAEEGAYRFLSNLTDDTARKTVKPLLDARESIGDEE